MNDKLTVQKEKAAVALSRALALYAARVRDTLVANVADRCDLSDFAVDDLTVIIQYAQFLKELLGSPF